MSLTYKNIIVAVDGSNASEIAFNRAIQVAINNKESILYIVHVIDTRTFAMYESYSRDIAEQINDLASEMLDAYERKALSAGVEQVQTIVEYGSPKQIIAREIPQLKKVDLIICGVSGKGGVERFLLGSVSESIVRSAKCDVLVVRNKF